MTIGGRTQVERTMALMARFREALAHLRSAATAAEIRYLSRVAVHGVVRPSEPRQVRASGPLRVLATGADAVRRLPAYIRQLVWLARDSSGGWLAVALASNRIPRGHDSDVRGELARLTAPIGAEPPGPVASRIQSANGIILFDPLPVSSWWKGPALRQEDRCIIVDGAFLVLLVVVSPLRAIRALRGCLRHVRTDRERRSLRDWSALAGGMLAAVGFEVVLARRTTTAGVFLTSNSVLTEQLRAYLIARSEPTEILEVLHGIGSIPVHDYFERLVAAAYENRPANALRFVPQIPHLPFYGALRANLLDPSNGLGVNAYLNRALQRVFPNGRVDGPSTTALLRRLGVPTGAGPDRPVIVTVFGNCPNDDRLYDSPSFQTEIWLMQQLRRVARELDLPLRLVYVPHPKFAGITFDQAAFGPEPPLIEWSSVVCWLLSDAGGSLLSSAMFEAAYFGVHTFTLMGPADAFYSAEYLGRLHTPTDDTPTAIRDALRRCLAVVQREELSSRLHRRLAAAGIESLVTI